MAMSSNCNPAAIPLPAVFGAEFLSIEAALVQNFTWNNPIRLYQNNGPLPNTAIDFCNVTLTHTHPGQNDTLRTQVWLPVSPEWNGRMQMAGGGGWLAGFGDLTFSSMYGALTDGYTTSTVDGGVQTQNGQTPEDWALLSNGNVDYNTLENFARKALRDGALATKSVIESFYGRPASYSYWNGCSQGGRQGYVFAQNYPDIFDGIAATAPAINWADFFPASAYQGQVVKELGVVPHPCEYATLRQAAIAACDGLDGLIDGLISNPDLCYFDPYRLVGSPTNCSSSSPGPSTISRAAATAVDALWHGFRSANGALLWPTGGYEVDLNTSLSSPITCPNNGNCTINRSPLFTEWIRLFVEKDTNFNVDTMTRDQFVHAWRAGIREYSSIIGTNSPDLTEFRESGHKLLTWHGLADDLIPYANTRRYYNNVAQLDPTVQSYYRLFEAPGVAHCFGGSGGIPQGMFKALVAWVEHGTAPESLVGTNPQGKTNLLCPYPKKAYFKGKSPQFSEKDFECH
ncbi:feruloyl esteras-like protein B precursor [Plenodomus tracheiphilus IPT5]|uniref:Carboxylic ester hydrolase n=1 Tax=Plenodomus tracheiphilus IPT5 TaxID=1408161 RepID=A0A6A7BM23_9PLEO|nr:feruloyl esteras-like protein B precursor [Plenodomus tracheiphilus IPT5]